MHGKLARCGMVAMWLVLLAGGLRSALAQAPLAITTTTLPSVTAGSDVNLKIGSTGGALPLTWKVSGGKLPPGLELGAKSGCICGKPTTPGEYHFELTATDASSPAMQVQREFSLVVITALSIEWKRAPAVHGQSIDGSVIIGNLTKQDVSLTVIVMAVNEIGRATALGYQEFTLRSGAEQVIPFGSSPGPATYIVHAYAVGEVSSTNTIYRARKQTADPLVIQSPD